MESSCNRSAYHLIRCGPCHAIAPVFESLSKEYSNVNFLKCDTDAVKEVAQKYSISAMYVCPSGHGTLSTDNSNRPTFILLKGKTKIDQLKGADKV